MWFLQSTQCWGETGTTGEQACYAQFDSKGLRLATACQRDGYVRMYDMKEFETPSSTPRPVKPQAKVRVQGAEQPVSLAFSPDGSRLAVGFIDKVRVEVLEARGVTLQPAFSADCTGLRHRHTIGFISRIDQAGRSLTSVGWLTRAQGLPESALYTRPPATISTSPSASDASTVRFTVVSEATIQAISALGGVINTVCSGRTRIFFLPNGGASINDPASFATGSPIATMASEFQTNLAVDTPDHAAATLSGDLTQRSARVFTVDGQRYQLGRPGLAWTMRADGRGVRTEATTPKSQIFLSGDMGVIDAARTG